MNNKTKAYIVTVDDFADITTYISGINPGSAKSLVLKSLQSAGYDNVKFTAIKVRRFYKFDPIANEIVHCIDYHYANDLLFKHELRDKNIFI